MPTDPAVSPPRPLPHAGLTAAEVAASRRQFGSNVLEPPVRTPWWRQYLAKYDDPVIRILLIAAGLAILAGSVKGEYFEGVGVVVAVFLAATLAFLNEHQSGKAFDLLNSASDDDPVSVIRDGLYAEIPRREVVVGDLVLIEAGVRDSVPADGEVVEATALRLDEASLTGESRPVSKVPRSEADPGEAGERTYSSWQVLRGTTAMDGHGLVRITAVGDATEIGRLVAASTAETGVLTPLNAQLAHLSRLIGVLGFALAALTFLALLARGWVLGEAGTLTVRQGALLGLAFAGAAIAGLKVWLPIVYDALALLGRETAPPSFLEAEGAKPWLWTVGAGLLLFALGAGGGVALGLLPPAPAEWIPAHVATTLLGYFMIAVTLVVVAVPEGLAMSVTLSLAYSMRKMTRSNNLVKRLHACETIGAATVICADKTGTLTMNQMRVQETSILGAGGSPDGPAARLLVEGAIANSTAHLARVPGREPRAMGNPTEGALLLWLDRQGIDYLDRRRAFRQAGQLPFSTDRKMMATLGHSAVLPGFVLHVKGAPELLLARCSHVQGERGPEPIAPRRPEILRALQESQRRACRTLGFAYRPCREDDRSGIEARLGELVWLGFVAIADPVRPEVPPAAEACRRAGIQVKMVTGDDAETAREVGRQIGLFDASRSPDALMTGPAFSALSDAEARGRVGSLRILSRARPADKMRLVRLLQEGGEVVAVTGDGTNDAPALHQADVGLAMGRAGTSAAREASDIVLLDDSFHSIVNAVVWGRSLYLNIQRFLLFQLTINVAALVLALLGPFVGTALPFTVIQMLWINLIMDTFAALALATEPADPAVLDHPPRDHAASIVSPAMARSLFLTAGVFVAVLLTYLLAAGGREGGLTPRELTVFFATFVLLQFWNLFNARRLGSTASALAGLTANPYFLLIAAAILGGTVAIVQLGGSVFRTVPLDPRTWLAIAAGTSPVLLGGELVRLLRRSSARRSRGARP